MKKCHFIIIVVLFFTISAKSNTRVGFMFASNYSFNKSISQNYFGMQTHFDNSIFIETGGCFEYKPTKRIGVAAKLSLSPVKYSYRYDEVSFDDQPIQTHYNFLENKLLIIKAPIVLHYFVIKNMYLSAGTGAEWNIGNNVMNKIEGYSTFGVGFVLRKLNIELLLDKPFANNGLSMVQFKPIDDFDNYVFFSNKIIKLELSYNLFSK